jgi:hypothetical protein
MSRRKLIGAVFFLASPDKHFITGQTIGLDARKILH